MTYQVTAADISILLTWAFFIVLAAVIVGVFFVDIIYAVFSRVFSSALLSLEPSERQVHQHIYDANQWILAGAARIRAEREAREASEVSE